MYPVISSRRWCPKLAGHVRISTGSQIVFWKAVAAADPLREPGPGMLAYMKRTTVKLPDDLDARLRHEAERRGSTVSALTREAIEAHLGGRVGRRKLIASAAGRSGSHDVSVRVEEILRNEVSA